MKENLKRKETELKKTQQYKEQGYVQSAQVKQLAVSKKYKTENGEETITETEIYKRVYGGAPFWRVWLGDLLYQLGLVNNSRQMDVLFYILDNTNSYNMFIGTYEKIRQDTGASFYTIAEIIKKMIENGIMTKQQAGLYMVNPKLLMKGDNVRKRRLIVTYENIEDEQAKKQKVAHIDKYKEQEHDKEK